jgi:predicted nucleic-acid-binding Zn-ribbon protein
LKLTVFERLILNNILPKEGDFITLKLVRKLREALAFGEKEIAEIDFKNEWKCPKCQRTELANEMPKCPDCGVYMQLGGQIHWDDEKAKKVIKDVYMGNKMLALCESTLKKLSDESKLTEQHMSLFEKFVEGANEEE